MVLILQVAAGVFLGLWLFRYVMTRQPLPPRNWRAIGLFAARCVALVYWVGLVYTLIVMAMGR